MMQCKDIPDEPILRMLARHRGRWCFLFFEPNITDAMPEGTPRRLAQAKMARLIRRGLVDGCPCGCRGDFEITAEGEAYLARGAE